METSDEEERLQGYCPRVNNTRAGGQCRRWSSEPMSEEVAAWRAVHPGRHRERCRACGKFGHCETRCESLAMFLYVKRYMKGKSEEDVQSVFEHWCERNRDYSKGRSREELTPTYQDVRGSVERRDIELRRMRREMN